VPENAPQTRRQRLEQRENAIVSAAHDIFSEHGFDGARMADIARSAKVAEGTIYLYFKNKHALLQAVVERFYEGLTDAAQIGVRDIGDTFECLRFLAAHHLLNCIREWRILELVTALYRNVPKYQTEGQYKLNKAYVAVFDDVIRTGVARGDVGESIPLWVVRDLFYGTLEYAARTQILRGKQEDIGVIIDNLMTILQSGVGQERSMKTGVNDLDNVTRRLEAVAARMESSN
jgi:AcrR family transcriptional regulator